MLSMGREDAPGTDRFGEALAGVHEARRHLIEATVRQAERQSRVGRFIAGIGVSRAERALKKSNNRYDKALFGARRPDIARPADI